MKIPYQSSDKTLAANFLASLLSANLIAVAAKAGTQVVAWGNTNDWDDAPPNLTNVVAVLTEPVRFIMMHEPPARPFSERLFHWHFASGQTTVQESAVARDPQKFLSPTLFVDGHARTHDFTAMLKSAFPFEPTADWISYKTR
jgi:hypothetical protein